MDIVRTGNDFAYLPSQVAVFGQSLFSGRKLPLQSTELDRFRMPLLPGPVAKAKASAMHWPHLSMQRAQVTYYITVRSYRKSQPKSRGLRVQSSHDAAPPLTLVLSGCEGRSPSLSLPFSLRYRLMHEKRNLLSSHATSTSATPTPRSGRLSARRAQQRFESVEDDCLDVFNSEALHVDKFGFTCDRLGSVSSLEVMPADAAISSTDEDWFIQSFTIEDRDNRLQYHFECNQWLISKTRRFILDRPMTPPRAKDKCSQFPTPRFSDTRNSSRLFYPSSQHRMDHYSGDESILFSERSEKIFQHIYHVEPRIFSEELEGPAEVFPTPDWCEQMCTLNLKLLVTVHRQYTVNLLENGYAITQELVDLEGRHTQACPTQLPPVYSAQKMTFDLLQLLYSLESIQSPKFEVLDIDAVEIQLHARKFPCVGPSQFKEMSLLETTFICCNFPATVTRCCLEDNTAFRSFTTAVSQLGNRCCNRTESIEEMEPGPLTYTLSVVVFHSNDCTLSSVVSYDTIIYLPETAGVNSVQPSGDTLYDEETEEDELVFHKNCAPTISPPPYIRSPKDLTCIYHISPSPLLATQTVAETTVMNEKPEELTSEAPAAEEQEQVFVLQVTGRLDLSLQQKCAVRSDFAVVRTGTLIDFIAPLGQLITDDTLGFDGTLRTESPLYETAADSIMETEYESLTFRVDRPLSASSNYTFTPNIESLSVSSPVIFASPM
ncbi:hypothetical protein AAHC03_016723 [Spirometra sp. Aus1]